MGAWGTGNFENDSALDFVADLKEMDPVLLKNAIVFLAEAESEQELDSDDCCAALVAAEYVAAARGNASPAITDEQKKWIAEKDIKSMDEAHDLASHARSAVERIRTQSELQELWEESDHFQEWYKVQEELIRRLA